MTNKNAIVIHGGGLVDPSKWVLMRLARNLKESGEFDNVFIGLYSFEALYTPFFWKKYDEELEKLVSDKRGTFFGTCRGIDLTDEELSAKAISCLKEYKISTIVVAGGDGSARQVAEISEVFEKSGINIIFAVPLTIDGINGGNSIGLNEAVSESLRQLENVCATSLETRDNEKYGVVAIELQGRNRDDILANVLKKIDIKGFVADIPIDNITIKVVPANFETDKEALFKEINGSFRRTLILLSEGASLKIDELSKKVTRKVRYQIVGHASQSNALTTKENIKVYNKMVDTICEVAILKNLDDSFCVVYDDGQITIAPIDYYALLNPRIGQKAQLPEDLKELLKIYMS